MRKPETNAAFAGHDVGAFRLKGRSAWGGQGAVRPRKHSIIFFFKSDQKNITVHVSEFMMHNLITSFCFVFM